MFLVVPPWFRLLQKLRTVVKQLALFRLASPKAIVLRRFHLASPKSVGSLDCDQSVDRLVCSRFGVVGQYDHESVSLVLL